jgi:hypothetical protein
MPAWAYLGVAAGIFIAFIPFLIKRQTPNDQAPKSPAINKAATATLDARLDPFSSKIAALAKPLALPPLSVESIALPPNAKVKVFSPISGQAVGSLIEVAASSKNLPSKYERWLIVHANNAAAKFFPQEIRQGASEFIVPVNLHASIAEGTAIKLLLFVTDRKGGDKLRTEGSKITELPPGQYVELNLLRAVSASDATGTTPKTTKPINSNLVGFNGVGARLRMKSTSNA